MKVLSVASEVYPLIKTGGLADVAGALPSALAPQGVEMRTLVPGYPKVMDALDQIGAEVAFEGGRILTAKGGGLDLFVLDWPSLFKREGGPYSGTDGNDFGDNPARFAALSRAAIAIARGAVTWQPDLIHAHDWQAALVPVYARYQADIPTVLTIHNIAFQGRYSGDIFSDLGLPEAAYGMDGLEYYGDVSFLKGGLATANAITTVSPTYAREILGPAYGMGMEGVIGSRAKDLHGIVNGIDTDVWDPATDPTLTANYSARGLGRRKANKAAVAARFGLEGDGPIFAVVSRLTAQKGLDILADRVGALVGMGARLAVLGSGDPTLERAFTDAAERHPGKVGTLIGYDEGLSHLMQGGADAFLIPSRFEPCGLTQLYALRYGCIPVVARTGGLADTVIDANMAAIRAGTATGVIHDVDNGDALEAALRRTVALYEQPKLWGAMQRAGMKTDVGWGRSAGEYAALYRDLLQS
ncbi:glycogen synthase GlgA [Pontivivens insulae]|uniref:Glycogen synthase n=1 Tax=Pontivivens insulae TaxID=1639689 RepID=A0A2R8AD63_9RHOB|nr:glycogen synthase GlgA [Pontivivens insulae]RED14075.1 starch synthase [Pontivivens insulae]SPF30149.1 Glycogen synthase 1 [Pontivivens insulae]